MSAGKGDERRYFQCVQVAHRWDDVPPPIYQTLDRQGSRVWEQVFTCERCGKTRTDVYQPVTFVLLRRKYSRTHAKVWESREQLRRRQLEGQPRHLSAVG